MEPQKQKDTGDKEQCHLCRITYSIFSTLPSLPSAMAMNVETGEFFPLDRLHSYSTGHDMAEALGYAWACNCRERARRWYDERFTLNDAGGKVLTDTYYTIRLSSGEPRHGITDSQGRTERHVTEGSQSIRIYLGHNEEV